MFLRINDAFSLPISDLLKKILPSRQRTSIFRQLFKWNCATGKVAQCLLMKLLQLFANPLVRSARLVSVKMSSKARLDAVPVVEIDEGVFKYILIKVYGKAEADGSEPSKQIVR